MGNGDDNPNSLNSVFTPQPSGLEGHRRHGPSSRTGSCQTYLRLNTVGHRRQVTAVTRLPRWQRRKTWLQVRPLLTTLCGMARCDFWNASRYGTYLTCHIIMAGRFAPEQPVGTLAFSVRSGWLDQKRRVTKKPSILGGRWLQRTRCFLNALICDD